MKQVAPWVLTHRPKKFSEVVGQAAVASALQGMLSRQTLPNAILFYGPAGTGKTTLGRIFATAVNCETHDNCGKCASCKQAGQHPDITELNAATHRGIDEARALIQQAKYKARYGVRVIIIDEAHQFTPQAMEALLKPLEEPGFGTMFILCTTDPQKFTSTLLSRCVKMPVEPPSPEEVTKRLRLIAKREKVEFPKELFPAITNIARGCVREAVNLLETAANMQAGDPNMDNAALVKGITQAAGDDAVSAATRLLLGMYSSKQAVIAKAILSAPDMLKLVNQAIWFNEYLLASLLDTQTSYVFHAPANREFASKAKAAFDKAKTDQRTAVNAVLDAQGRLVTARTGMHAVSVKEVSYLLSVLP